MRSRHELKIKEGARPFLEEGEDVLVAFVARPRGWTQAAAGSSNLGFTQQGRAYDAADQAGFRLASPMALAITRWRLIVLRIGAPLGLGIGGSVKELVAAVPLADVDSIVVRRLLIGRVVTVTVRGVPFKLEANELADTKGLAAALERLKTAA